MKNKKMIIILIVILLAIILYFISGIESNEKFRFDPVTNTILGVYNSDRIETLIIPNEINGVKVKRIQISDKELPKLKTVIIQPGVEEIGERCFYNSTSLVSVSIPKTVKKISDQAFANCIQLINITIPNSVEDIGKKSFAECLKLENVAISNNIKNIGKDAFLGTKWLKNLLEDEDNLNNEVYKKIIEGNEN